VLLLNHYMTQQYDTFSRISNSIFSSTIDLNPSPDVAPRIMYSKHLFKPIASILTLKKQWLIPNVMLCYCSILYSSLPKCVSVTFFNIHFYDKEEISLIFSGQQHVKRKFPFLLSCYLIYEGNFPFLAVHAVQCRIAAFPCPSP